MNIRVSCRKHGQRVMGGKEVRVGMLPRVCLSSSLAAFGVEANDGIVTP